ncbi:MAG: ribonuclease III [Peptostreptococcaceae bacterium]|jgi:ribonuclease-3|nr:ribonuclease III [Peptostreptococcaceae bacterium]
MKPKQMKDFQEKIGYEFKNENYLREALTHSSYVNENKRCKVNYNERLEFLGDSVLGIIISHYLFEKKKNVKEGELTKLRAMIVCEESLSEVANEINLGEYLFLGKGEEATGGRERTSILADAMEAVIASIYLDGGFLKAKKFVLKYMKQIITNSMEGKIFRDYKTHLQEVLQSQKTGKINYRLVEEVGPDHNKKFLVEVLLDEESLGFGKGRTKKEAEQMAAKEALNKVD